MLTYHPYAQGFVDAARAGGPDANGQAAERAISSGQGAPCRSCLNHVPEGEEMLILAARPFPALQPYAETGPIFLCAKDCTPWPGDGLPPVLTMSPEYLVKAYTSDDRILYGTGQITPKSEVAGHAEHLLSNSQVAYVDVRSARNNCFLTRITRAT